MIKRLIASLVPCMTAVASAADQAAASDQHPVLSSNSVWGGIMIIVILAMFLLAIVIGPVVRVLSPPPVPDAPFPDETAGAHAHEHDEHDHGHGH